MHHLSSSSSLINILLPAKKKRKRKRHELVLRNVIFQEQANGFITPRIIVSQVIREDARLSYAQMVQAVYNSCDFNFMTRFLKSYFRSDYCGVHNFSGDFPAQMLSQKLEIHGLELSGKFWYERMLDFPDLLFRIRKSEVVIESDENGVIICDFEMLATGIYPARPQEVKQAEIMIGSDSRPVLVMSSDLKVEKVDVQEGNFDEVVGCSSQHFGITDNDGSLQEDIEKILPAHTIERSFLPLQSTCAAELKPVEHITTPSNHPEEKMMIVNEPLATAACSSSSRMETRKLCFKGQFRMNFDSDSRIYLTEYSLHK